MWLSCDGCLNETREHDGNSELEMLLGRYRFEVEMLSLVGGGWGKSGRRSMV